MRKTLTLLAAVSYLVLGAACTDDDRPYQGSWVAPSGALRAMPGAFSPVALQVKNEGTTAWKPGDVTVQPQALPDGWQGGVLKLTRQTKPGEVGTFLGNLSASPQVGLYELSWALHARGSVSRRPRQTGGGDALQRRLLRRGGALRQRQVRAGIVGVR